MNHFRILTPKISKIEFKELAKLKLHPKPKLDSDLHSKLLQLKLIRKALGGTVLTDLGHIKLLQGL